MNDVRLIEGPLIGFGTLDRPSSIKPIVQQLQLTCLERAQRAFANCATLPLEPTEPWFPRHEVFVGIILHRSILRLKFAERRFRSGARGEVVVQKNSRVIEYLCRKNPPSELDH